MKKCLLQFTLWLTVLALGSYASADVSLIALNKDKLSNKYKLIQQLASEHITKKKIALVLGMQALKRRPLNLSDFDSVIVLFVTENDFLHEKNKYGSEKLSAIFIEPSPIDSVNLARAIFGDSRRFLIPIYTSNNTIKKISESNAEVKIIDTSKNTKWLGNVKKKDVVIATPDRNIYSSKDINTISKSLYRRRSPLIGFSKTMVDKVLAVASLTISDDALLSRIVEILKMAEQDKLSPMGYHVTDYGVEVNKTLLKTMGIFYVDEMELKRKVERLRVGQ